MASNSLWHEVSDVEKEEIASQINVLLKDFASQLESSKLPKASKREVVDARDEGEGWVTDSLFRDIMFLNAPLVDNDLIVAERGKWKKK